MSKLELADGTKQRLDVVKRAAGRQVGRVVDRAAEVEADVALGELVDDVARVGQRAGAPVEPGHDERVAGAGTRTRFGSPGRARCGQPPALRGRRAAR